LRLEILVQVQRLRLFVAGHVAQDDLFGFGATGAEAIPRGSALSYIERDSYQVVLAAAQYRPGFT
jgi:hypothetical protein